jgi:hypothetical protein
VEAYGYDWKLLTDDRAVIQGAQSALKQLGEESRRFLR